MSQAQVMRRHPRVELALPTDPCSVAAGPDSSLFSLHVPKSHILQTHLSKGDLEVSCSTRWLTSHRQISTVLRPDCISPLAMERRHPLESVRLVIRDALPNVTVESINALPSRRLLRFFSIKLSDGRRLLLSLSPPTTLRLLRSERILTLSETVVTKWILETVLESPDQVEGSVHESVTLPRHIESKPRTDEQIMAIRGIQGPRENILRYLPILVTHSHSSVELGSPFNIFEVTQGDTITELAPPLTRSEKQMVDFQQGQFIRQLSGFRAPMFGPAVGVIGPSMGISDPHFANADLPGASIGVRGVKSWRHAFHSLLEGVLRDAEDMAVTISYELIRDYFDRLGHFLNGIHFPRLVILDANDESNVLVSRSTKDAENIPSQQDKRTETEIPLEKPESSHDPKGEQRSTINVTGLRDWSNCIFGDPLMAEVFSQNPTTEFLRGFQGLNIDDPTTASGEGIPLYDESLIENRETAAIRLLLYECYHATVGVVKTFYRPGPHSSDGEITARRRLATVLRKLQEVDEETMGKRPRRPSANVEMWPVKKARGDSPLPSIESSVVKIKQEEE